MVQPVAVGGVEGNNVLRSMAVSIFLVFKLNFFNVVELSFR